MKKIFLNIDRCGIRQILILVLSSVINVLSQQKSSVLLNNDILRIRAEGISFLGSGMHEDDAKTFAINDAKRTALEQAGTYIESHTTIINYQLVKDEVITYSAGLLKVKVEKENRTMINNMFAFKVQIYAAIDMKILNQRVEEIRKNNILIEQLNSERERIKKLEARIDELQKLNTQTTQKDVRDVIDKLTASDWYQKGSNIKLYTENMIDKIDCYSRAIDLDPQYYKAFQDRGQCYGYLDQNEFAVRDLSKAIQIAQQVQNVKDLLDLYHSRAMIYSGWSKYAEAIQDLSSAIELNSDLHFSRKHNPLSFNKGDLYLYRGENYFWQGNYIEAVKDYTRAIDFGDKTRDLDCYSSRGFAYYYIKEYNAAISDFNKALAIFNKAWDYEPLNDLFGKPDSTKAELYLYRGLSHEKISNNAAACADFNNYLREYGSKTGKDDKIRKTIRQLGYSPEY